jgi:hypothetical protein
MSDKIQLTLFSGDKQAWPIYLSIGNIHKNIRRKPSKRTTILVGYIPVSKLKCFSEGAQSREGHQLFHECMKQLLELLIKAETEGVEMTCANGFLWKVFPILAAYIADYPEQVLLSAARRIAALSVPFLQINKGQSLFSQLPETQRGRRRPWLPNLKA